MAIRKKRKKRPVASAVPERILPPERRTEGSSWFGGVADRLTDPTSQSVVDTGPLAGRNLLTGARESDNKPQTKLSPAAAFVKAVISGDREEIKDAYANLSFSDAPAIKTAFSAMPTEQRSLVISHVQTNKDLFSPIAVTAFETFMKTAPAPPAGTKPLNFDPVALEGDEALAAMGGAKVMPAVPRDSAGGKYTASDLTSQGVSPKYATQTADRINSLDASIRDRYASAVVDFSNKYGAQGYDITINRAAVSEAEQRRVNATISGRAAAPQNSWHTIGAAADFSIYKNGILDKGDAAGNAYKTLLPGVLAPNGLSNPFPDDVGHVQPVEVPERRYGKTLAEFIKPVAGGENKIAAAGGGGTPEARQVRDLLTAGRADLGVKPLPAAVAAGAVGNMMQEAYQNLRPDAKGAAGERGIGQWMPDRYANMVAWTTANGLDPNSREGQALFYSHELQTSPTMARLAGIETPAEAAQIIATHFERAGNPMMERRVAFANAIAVGAPDIVVDSSSATMTGSAKSVAGETLVANAIQAGGGLRKGSRNVEANKALQSALNELGATDRFGNPLKVDGVYGNRTKEAVKNYQTKNGLVVDGVVGPQTFGQIKSDMTADAEAFGVGAGEMPGARSGGLVYSNPARDAFGLGQPDYTTSLSIPPSALGFRTDERDYAAGAAAAAVTVDPVVARAFVPSGKATLDAALGHPDETFISSNREWDPAAARIAGTLRDAARMDAEVRAAMAKAGKTKFAEPVQADMGVKIPKSFSEWLGPRPGDPIEQHQPEPERGLLADAGRAWESVKQGFDVESWLSSPTVQDSPYNSSASITDPYRPTGGSILASSSSGDNFDSFASGMSSAYQSVSSGGSVFSSNPASTYAPGGSNTTVQTDAAGRVLGGI